VSNHLHVTASTSKAGGPIATAVGGTGYTLQMFQEHLGLAIQIGSGLLVLGGLLLTYYNIRNARRSSNKP
jgi:hypothetical protein